MAVDQSTVRTYYEAVLRKEPTEAEVNSYANLANTTVLLQTLQTVAQTTVNPIIRLYQAAFDRVPDSDGLDYWVGQFDQNGGPLTTGMIAGGFQNSAEFQSVYGGLNNLAFVSALYVNILGRTGEQAGVDFWVNSLANGMTRAEVLNGFAQSLEFTSNSLAPIQQFQANSADGTETYTGSLFDQVQGATYTLTTGIDVITGGASNDTFIGEFAAAPNNTLNAADRLNGGGGKNTLEMYGAFDAAQMPVSLQNMQVFKFGSAQADASIDLSAYTKAQTGLELIEFSNISALDGQTITTTAGQTVSLSTGAAGAATAGAAVTWAGSATDTAQNLVLNGYQGGVAAGAAQDLTVEGARTTTLNITSQGAVPTGSTVANQIGTLTAAATTTLVNINATSAFAVNTSLVGARIAEVNASTSTAGVTVNVNGTAGNLKITGGSGNDTFIFGANNTFTALDTVDGGAGNDTLGMLRAQAANTTTAFTNITNIETLRVTDATANNDVFNLAHFGVQNIRFDGAVTAVEARTVTNIASGATLTLVAGAGNGTGSTNLTIRNNSQDDSLTIAARGAAGTFTVDASQFEKVTLNAGNVTGAGAPNVLTLALTNPQLKELTIINPTATGTNSDVSVNTGTLGTVVSKVDASAFVAATQTNGVTITLNGAAINGATVLGSNNNDEINGSNQDDTINGGAGNDTITGGAGADVMTGGTGSNTFVQGLEDSELGVFANVAGTATVIDATDTITFVNGLDIVTDFTAGTGGDVLDVSASVAADFGDVISGIGETITALTADSVLFLSGAYVEATGVFTVAADGAGADTLILQTLAGTPSSLNIATNQSAILLQGVDSDNLVAGNFIFV